MDAEQQLALTATEAVEAVKTGRLSAEAYVRTLLDRADQHSSLNAMIVLDREGAIAAAKQVDEGYRQGRAQGPLAGLPIVVKDNINTKNLPTTGGTPALAGSRPSANAPSLQKLIDAGAIVLGKSNLHELAFGITSSNLSPFAKPVKNPYDVTRIPGGSSGGTGAAVAARFAPAGLGTDTGGSTRVPAALTGIVGFRPSVGDGGAQRRYTDAGSVVPISHTRDTIGPMARSVADVALLDAVITGAAPVNAVALNGLRIGLPASFWAGLDTQVDAVTRAAVAKLKAAGVEFVEVDLPIFELNDKLSFPIALHEPMADIPAYLSATGVKGVSLADIAAKVASPDVKGAFGAIMADAFGAAYPEAINTHRPALQQRYSAYFTQHRLDAMLFPTTITTAAVIDAVNGSSTVSINGGAPQDTFTTFIRNTDPGSNAGIPGLSLPAGLSATGLPVGLELDGPLGSDRRLIGIALSVEAVLGRLPAPKL